jgi:hypothetical protein
MGAGPVAGRLPGVVDPHVCGSVSLQDVTAACLDDRQRKIIVGTQSGSIEVFNCVNGAYMKPGVSHAKEITAMRYCKEDRCVLSVGWDCNIMVSDGGALLPPPLSGRILSLSISLSVYLSTSLPLPPLPHTVCCPQRRLLALYLFPSFVM